MTRSFIRIDAPLDPRGKKLEGAIFNDDIYISGLFNIDIDDNGNIAGTIRLTQNDSDDVWIADCNNLLINGVPAPMEVPELLEALTDFSPKGATDDIVTWGGMQGDIYENKELTQSFILSNNNFGKFDQADVKNVFKEIILCNPWDVDFDSTFLKGQTTIRAYGAHFCSYHPGEDGLSIGVSVYGVNPLVPVPQVDLKMFDHTLDEEVKTIINPGSIKFVRGEEELLIDVDYDPGMHEVFHDDNFTGLGIDIDPLKLSQHIYLPKTTDNNPLIMLGEPDTQLFALQTKILMDEISIFGKYQDVGGALCKRSTVLRSNEVLVGKNDVSGNLTYRRLSADSPLTNQGVPSINDFDNADFAYFTTGNGALRINTLKWQIRDITDSALIEVTKAGGTGMATISARFSIIDNLESVSPYDVLSAAQGKIIFDFVKENMGLKMAGPFETVAEITPMDGYLYLVGTESPYQTWAQTHLSDGGLDFVQIGDTEIDLSDYYTKPQADENFIVCGSISANLDKNFTIQHIPTFQTSYLRYSELRVGAENYPIQYLKAEGPDASTLSMRFAVQEDGSFFCQPNVLGPLFYCSGYGLQVMEGVEYGGTVTFGMDSTFGYNRTSEVITGVRTSSEDFSSKEEQGLPKFAINRNVWQVQNLTSGQGISVFKEDNGVWTISNTGGSWGAITGNIFDQADLLAKYVVADPYGGTPNFIRNNNKGIILRNTYNNTEVFLQDILHGHYIHAGRWTSDTSATIDTNFYVSDGAFFLKKLDQTMRYITYGDVAGLQVTSQYSNGLVTLGNKNYQDLGADINSVEAITPSRVSLTDFKARAENRGQGNYNKLAINDANWKIKDVFVKDHLTRTYSDTDKTATIGYDGYKLVTYTANLWVINNPTSYTLPDVNDYDLGMKLVTMVQPPNCFVHPRYTGEGDVGASAYNRTNYWIHPYAVQPWPFDTASGHHWSQRLPAAVQAKGINRIGYLLNYPRDNYTGPGVRAYNAIALYFWNQYSVTDANGNTINYSGASASDGVQFELIKFNESTSDKYGRYVTPVVGASNKQISVRNEVWGPGAYTEGWGTLNKTRRIVEFEKALYDVTYGFYNYAFRCDEDALSGAYTKTIAKGSTTNSGIGDGAVYELNTGEYYYQFSGASNEMVLDHMCNTAIINREGYVAYKWYYVGLKDDGTKQWKQYWPDVAVSDGSVSIPAITDGQYVYGEWNDAIGCVYFMMDMRGGYDYFQYDSTRRSQVASPSPTPTPADNATVSAGKNIVISTTTTDTATDYKVATSFDIVDSLTSTSATNALSAKQGKELKDMVSAMINNQIYSGPYAAIANVPTPYQSNYLYLIGEATPYSIYVKIGEGLTLIGSTEVDLSGKADKCPAYIYNSDIINLGSATDLVYTDVQDVLYIEQDLNLLRKFALRLRAGDIPENTYCTLLTITSGAAPGLPSYEVQAKYTIGGDGIKETFWFQLCVNITTSSRVYFVFASSDNGEASSVNLNIPFIALDSEGYFEDEYIPVTVSNILGRIGFQEDGTLKIDTSTITNTDKRLILFSSQISTSTVIVSENESKSAFYPSSYFPDVILNLSDAFDQIHNVDRQTKASLLVNQFGPGFGLTEHGLIKNQPKIGWLNSTKVDSSHVNYYSLPVSSSYTQQDEMLSIFDSNFDKVYGLNVTSISSTTQQSESGAFVGHSISSTAFPSSGNPGVGAWAGSKIRYIDARDLGNSASQVISVEDLDPIFFTIDVNTHKIQPIDGGGGGATVEWGNITGTITAQSDLIAQFLPYKKNLFDASNITNGGLSVSCVNPDNSSQRIAIEAGYTTSSSRFFEAYLISPSGYRVSGDNFASMSPTEIYFRASNGNKIQVSSAWVYATMSGTYGGNTYLFGSTANDNLENSGATNDVVITPRRTLDTDFSVVTSSSKKKFAINTTNWRVKSLAASGSITVTEGTGAEAGIWTIGGGGSGSVTAQAIMDNTSDSSTVTRSIVSNKVQFTASGGGGGGGGGGVAIFTLSDTITNTTFTKTTHPNWTYYKNISTTSSTSQYHNAYNPWNTDGDTTTIDWNVYMDYTQAYDKTVWGRTQLDYGYGVVEQFIYGNPSYNVAQKEITATYRSYTSGQYMTSTVKFKCTNDLANQGEWTWLITVTPSSQLVTYMNNIIAADGYCTSVQVKLFFTIVQTGNLHRFNFSSAANIAQYFKFFRAFNNYDITSSSDVSVLPLVQPTTPVDNTIWIEEGASYYGEDIVALSQSGGGGGGGGVSASDVLLNEGSSYAYTHNYGKKFSIPYGTNSDSAYVLDLGWDSDAIKLYRSNAQHQKGDAIFTVNTSTFKHGDFFFNGYNIIISNGLGQTGETTVGAMWWQQSDITLQNLKEVVRGSMFKSTDFHMPNEDPSHPSNRRIAINDATWKVKDIVSTDGSINVTINNGVADLSGGGGGGVTADGDYATRFTGATPKDVSFFTTGFTSYSSSNAEDNNTNVGLLPPSTIMGGETNYLEVTFKLSQFIEFCKDTFKAKSNGNWIEVLTCCLQPSPGYDYDYSPCIYYWKNSGGLEYRVVLSTLGNLYPRDLFTVTYDSVKDRYQRTATYASFTDWVMTPGGNVAPYFKLCWDAERLAVTIKYEPTPAAKFFIGQVYGTGTVNLDINLLFPRTFHMAAVTGVVDLIDVYNLAKFVESRVNDLTLSGIKDTPIDINRYLPDANVANSVSLIRQGMYVGAGLQTDEPTASDGKLGIELSSGMFTNTSLSLLQGSNIKACIQDADIVATVVTGGKVELNAGASFTNTLLNAYSGSNFMGISQDSSAVTRSLAGNGKVEFDLRSDLKEQLNGVLNFRRIDSGDPGIGEYKVTTENKTGLQNEYFDASFGIATTQTIFSGIIWNRELYDMKFSYISMEDNMINYSKLPTTPSQRGQDPNFCLPLCSCELCYQSRNHINDQTGKSFRLWCWLPEADPTKTSFSQGDNAVVFIFLWQSGTSRETYRWKLAFQADQKVIDYVNSVARTEYSYIGFKYYLSDDDYGTYFRYRFNSQQKPNSWGNKSMVFGSFGRTSNLNQIVPLQSIWPIPVQSPADDSFYLSNRIEPELVPFDRIVVNKAGNSGRWYDIYAPRPQYYLRNVDTHTIVRDGKIIIDVEKIIKDRSESSFKEITIKGSTEKGLPIHYNGYVCFDKEKGTFATYEIKSINCKVDITDNTAILTSKRGHKIAKSHKFTLHV